MTDNSPMLAETNFFGSEGFDFEDSQDLLTSSVDTVSKETVDIEDGDDHQQVIFFDPRAIRDISERINAVRIKTYTQLNQEMDLSWVAKKDYRIIHTKRELLAAIFEMNKYNYIAVDTETTGLNFCNISLDNAARDVLVGICISWKPNQGIYIPVNMAFMENIDLHFALTALKPILEGKSIVTHNGIFDAKVFYTLGIMLNVVHDTMYLQFDIDGDIYRGTRKLKGLVQYWFKYTPLEFEDIFEYEKDYRLFRYCDEEVTRVYACGDADHTLSLLPILLKQLKPWQMKGYKKHIALIHPLMRSEYEGKNIDMNLLKTLNEINDRDLEKVENLIYRYVGTEMAYRSSGKFSSEMYKFHITSGPELADVCFNKLFYPRAKSAKEKKSTGAEEKKNTINKSLLKYWGKEKEKSGFTKAAESLFEGDLMSDSVNHPELHLSDKEHILLKKDIFVNTKFRMTLLIQLYRKLHKNKTSFFNNLLNNNTEGKMFTGIVMTRAATFRILDTIQTLDGRLKKLICPPEGYYQIAADYGQIEARVVAGFAKDIELVKQLDHPEADYHRLAAAKILKKKPEEVTGDERRAFKPVNFGIIYGLGARGMLDQTDGIGLSEEEYKKRLKETEETIKVWEVGMHLVKGALDRCRDIACTPIPQSEVPYTFEGKKAGRVMSPGGRARYFNLEDLTQSKIASIRRKAGNFPIQSFAFDIFAEGVISWHNILKSAGLIDVKVSDDFSPLGYHFENYVKVIAYVHDEMEIFVRKDINPKWALKKLYQAMVLQIEGFPRFYIGAGIVKNWYEAKSGDHELPTQMFWEISEDEPIHKPYEEESQEKIDEEIYQFLKRRCVEEFNKIGVDIENVSELSTTQIDNMTSYYIKEKICDLVPTARKANKDENRYNDKLCACLEYMFGHPLRIIVDTTKLDNILSDDRDSTYDEEYYAFREFGEDLADEEEEELE